MRLRNVVLGLFIALAAVPANGRAAMPVSPGDGTTYRVGERIELQARFDAYDTVDAPAVVRLSTSRTRDANGMLNGPGTRVVKTTQWAGGGAYKFALGSYPKPTGPVYWQPIDYQCVKTYDFAPQYCEIGRDVPGPIRAFKVVLPKLSVRLGSAATQRPRGSPAFAVSIACSTTCSLTYHARAYVRTKRRTVLLRRLSVSGTRSRIRRARLSLPAVKNRPYLRRIIKRHRKVIFRVRVTAGNGIEKTSETRSIILRPPRKPRAQRPLKPRQLTRSERVRRAVVAEAFRTHELNVYEVGCRELSSARYRCDFSGLTQDDIRTGNVDGHSGSAYVTIYPRAIDVNIVSYRRGGN